LYKGDCPSSSYIDDIFAVNPDDAQNFCGLIEERIVDTAILGVDLHAIERDALASLADRLSEEQDALERPAAFGFSWGKHTDFVPLIRPFLRMMALTNNMPDFTDREVFPRRR
jgi:hypothetical protein